MEKQSGFLRSLWRGVKLLRRLGGEEGVLRRLERLEARADQEWGPVLPDSRLDDLYFAFEERHRGPRELIRGRLEFYLPWVRETARAGGELLDLGCGRGEWLELLRDRGLSARGVDRSARMVEAARARGLRADTGDLLPCLRGLPEAGLAGISAFHVVEHLPLPALLELLAGARRALRPGGLLILETPNPENPVVGSCDFFVDPTHRRAVPPDLLAFLVEQAGFSAVEVARVPASAPRFAAGAAPEGGPLRALAERMETPYDYAVIARVTGA